jgi:glutaminase
VRTTSFQQYLEQLHARFSTCVDGAVADYIPELTKVPADLFGIALVTADGHVYQAGDSREAFSIQSISKAFTYGIALEDCGEERAARKIDVEPSGEAFNSISLEYATGRPRNPMINAGAIVATSLVKGDTAEEKLQRILSRYADYAGRPLAVNEAIYRSEKATGHRNRAIAHLLRNYDILEDDPEQPLDAYFRQCSIMVTARDLALMGATLANDGVNPITGVRALQTGKVPRVLSVMATCGMYDFSGNWIYGVGMPAKSGVGGGVVAVLPGQLGLAVFSPRLDARGNSVRGIAVCEAFSRDFGLHMLRVTRTTTTSVIRTRYTGAEVRSKLNRDLRSTRYLDREGERILVLEATGELMFVSAEIIASGAIVEMESRDYLVLDLSRVASIDQPAATLLAELMEALSLQGKTVLVTGASGHYAFCQSVRNYFNRRSGPACGDGAPAPTGAGIPRAAPNFDYADVDRALEYAEDRLLEQGHIESHDSHQVPLEEQPLCQNLDARELQTLRGLLVEEHHERGDAICTEGQSATHVYFLDRGRVSVSLQLDSKRRRRLGAFAAGWVFGEAAFFDGHRRTADVIADSAVRLYALDTSRLKQSRDPAVQALFNKLVCNLSELNLHRLARANDEIRILTR